MEAVRSGRRFVRLDGETWVGLSDQLRERMARLAAEVRTDKRGRSTIAPMSGEVLEALAGDGAEVDAPESLHVEADRIRQARAATLPSLRACRHVVPTRPRASPGCSVWRTGRPVPASRTTWGLERPSRPSGSCCIVVLMAQPWSWRPPRWPPTG